MYVRIAILALVAALVVVGQVLKRRRHRQIREMVTAGGGNVIKIGLAPSFGDLVDYISPQGDLRRAILPRGKKAFCDDTPFELVLKEQYERPGDEMLRAIMLAAKYSRLPGYEAYKSLVLGLAAGTQESVTSRRPRRTRTDSG